MAQAIKITYQQPYLDTDGKVKYSSAKEVIVSFGPDRNLVQARTEFFTQGSVKEGALVHRRREISCERWSPQFLDARARAALV